MIACRLNSQTRSKLRLKKCSEVASKCPFLFEGADPHDESRVLDSGSMDKRSLFGLADCPDVVSQLKTAQWSFSLSRELLIDGKVNPRANEKEELLHQRFLEREIYRKTMAVHAQ